ncbi:SIR2 family NAD-dependent protein deacylase [Metabacillus dongyingensis]|uniref:SIR2 family NAD-dependent protein deacylase n=1 Tax=Metabacillus dongyingensis TaxID=2874282 RepID=UPI001FB330ED|nr:SIR2 family protein [Metabacillus dongyingensis]UNJ81300.1 hypothetical protein [Metabacillus dongyingensis]
MLGEITTKIITTNYDQSLEEANPNFQKIDQLHEFDLATLDGLENYIFKLHGCISNVSSCVLFKADYDDLYNQNTAAIERLKSIITDQTIIFLGFSLSDPFVKMQFEYINKVYKGLGKTHYFVTTSDNNELKDYGVSPIKLDNWSDIPIFLEMLKKKINY